ncbi:MAG: hypothetical protein IIY21_17525, partial [Clostridiales bacterium]|nr:hypothetical protein [Clostridiales bacterium]
NVSLHVSERSEKMKSCAVCNGRKIRYIRDSELKITVKCEKCGAEYKTPCFTENNALGFWNSKQAELERMNREAAAS